MVEESSKWMLPENLRKSQEIERRLVDEGKFDGKSDFGSYYAFAKGIIYENFSSHTIIDDNLAYRYSKNLFTILKRFDVNRFKNVIDIGCAVGTITDGLRRAFEVGTSQPCTVYGIDISEDAIGYASKRYPDCRFLCQAADELENIPDKSIDIFHARHFYGFVRTNDIDYQLGYFKLFHQKLDIGGCVVIYLLSSTPSGFNNIYKKMAKELTEIGYEPVIRISMLPNRLEEIFGGYLYNSYLNPPIKGIVKLLFKLYKDKELCDVFIVKKRR